MKMSKFQRFIISISKHNYRSGRIDNYQRDRSAIPKGNCNCMRNKCRDDPKGPSPNPSLSKIYLIVYLNFKFFRPFRGRKTRVYTRGRSNSNPQVGDR